MTDWPVQADGKSWCWIEGDMPNDWRSRLERAAVVVDAPAKPQIWQGIHLDPERQGQLYGRFVLERNEPMKLVWGDKFEGEFYEAPDPYTGVEHEPHLTIPMGWKVAWIQDRDHNVRPEWKPKEPPMQEVFPGGLKSSGVHTSTAKHHTALYRQMNVEVGADYQLRAQIRFGDSKGHHAIGVGLDPYGGSDFESVDVRWAWWATWDSDWANQVWRQLATSIVAAHSERITLFLCSVQLHAFDAAAIFDEVELWADEGKPPDPPPDEPPQPGEPIDYDRIKDEVATEVINRWMLLVPQLRVMVGDE